LATSGDHKLAVDTTSGHTFSERALYLPHSWTGDEQRRW
jgi:hypothetical protein